MVSSLRSKKAVARARIAVVMICACLLIASSAAQVTQAAAGNFPCSATRTHQNIHTSDNSGFTKWTASWSGDNCSVDLRAEGQITFNPETTRLRSISPGGYFDLMLREGTSLRRIMIQPTADGSLKYEFSVNNQAQPFDASAQAWLSSLL